MTSRLRLYPINRWLEPLLAAVTAGGLVYAIWHLLYFYYFPQPFFYNPADAWADWFNVVYWSYDRGTYDVWGSLYPPMSFVFLRLFSLSRCYTISGAAHDASVGIAARTCDWLGIITIHAFYILNIILVAKIYLRANRNTALWRSYALVGSMPMLSAFEHANLLIPAFTFTLLGFGPFLKSARVRWLWIGIAINFKVYLISMVFPQLLLRRWRWVEGVLLATVSVYLISYALLGRGTIMEIITNIGVFSSGQAAVLLDVWFAATYLPFLSLLDNANGPMLALIGSRNINLLLTVLPLLQHVVQAAIIAAAALAWLRPEAVSRNRLTNLGVSLALITTESGGYTPVFIMFFTFLEPWEGFGRKWAIIACYILCIPLDIPIDRVPPIISDSFFFPRYVVADYHITLGPFLRPLILMSVPFALSCVTIRTVWADIRTQGWKSRRRFRRDFPIMVGEGMARRPLLADPASGPHAPNSANAQ